MGSEPSPQDVVNFPPAPRYGHQAVADVLGSAAAVLGVPGYTNILNLPPAERVVVVLVDGLGLEQLRQRYGYAPTLRRADLLMDLDAAFPTTTAASLASLGTAAPVGVHGLTGYDSYSPELGQPVNMLGNWHPMVDPVQWQPVDTVFQRAQDAGVDVVTISRTKFRASALTQATLRGGRFVGADAPYQRVQVALEQFCTTTKSLMYFYWDDLDKTGHHCGWQSQRWAQELEDLDSAVKHLAMGVPKNTVVLLTADHGMVDVPLQGRLDISAIPGLLDNVQVTFGEPRCVQLRVTCWQEQQRRQDAQQFVIERWQQEFGDRIHIATREQLMAGGWYGPVHQIRPEVVDRFGDLVVLPVGTDMALHDIARIGEHTLAMVGQHGGLTADELRVPLIALT